jgi:hypothetical protein
LNDPFAGLVAARGDVDRVDQIEPHLPGQGESRGSVEAVLDAFERGQPDEHCAFGVSLRGR